MKFLATSLLAAAGALAAPAIQKRDVTDLDILQYALTLEHLENVFYKDAISKWPEDEFIAAGFSKDYYNNLKYITTDEETHVVALTAAIKAAGGQPVEACEYKFPYTDVKSFVTLSSVLEGVGTSAYLGGAPLIKDKEYLGVAGSILVVEALHTSLTRFTLGEVAPANPFGTPLGINEVYTLAAAFITSCPQTNAALPVKAFPALVDMTGTPAAPGVELSLSMKDAPAAGDYFVTFVSGLSMTSVPAFVKDTMISVEVPETSMGQTYAILTNANVTGKLTDDLVVAGPVILEVTPPAPEFDLTIKA